MWGECEDSGDTVLEGRKEAEDGDRVWPKVRERRPTTE